MLLITFIKAEYLERICLYLKKKEVRFGLESAGGLVRIDVSFQSVMLHIR